MEIETRGCVYFFRHIGLSPVKIGYSKDPSPINRFEQFKTYAPYGSEIVGFIRDSNPKRLETELHRKFARDRINCEWFELSEDDIKKCIDFYSNAEDVRERNEFQIEWAKKLRVRHIDNSNVDLFEKVYSVKFIEEYSLVKRTTDELCLEFSLDKESIRKILRYLNTKAQIFKINGKTTSVYVLYKK